MHTFSQFLSKLLAILLVAGMVSACSKGDNKTKFLEVAKKHFDAGEYEKSKAEYMKVLRQEPGNAVALSQLGLIWMEQGAPRRAAPFLAEIVSRDPTNISIRSKLLTALISLQAYGQGYQEASGILKLDPANEEALLYLTASAATKEQIEAAKEAIAKFPARNPAASHAAAASLFLRVNDIDSAEKAARKALEANPMSVAAHASLARICLLKKNDFEAEDEFQIVSKLAPLRTPERLNLAELKFRQGAIGEARALVDIVTRQAGDYLPALILSARLATAAKNNGEALTILEKAAEIDPDNYEARVLQAELLIAEGKLEPAIGILENLLKVYQGQPGLQYFLAKAWVQRGEAGKALPLLTRTIDTSPDFVEAIMLLASLNLQRGQAEEALTQMASLLNKRPGFVPAMLTQAAAYQSLRRPGEAVNVMKILVREVPGNPDFRMQLGVVHREAGELSGDQSEFDEARKAFEEVLKLKPDDFNAVNQLADLDIRAKRFEDALQRVQLVLEKTPESSNALLLKGRIFSVQKKWDEAAATLQKAIETDPGNFAAYQLLIQVYVDGKKLPQALEHANQLLAKQPDNKQALLFAALICENQRDFAKARDHYETLIKVNPVDSAIMNNLACLYVNHLDNPARAYELARDARKLRPRADPAASLATRAESSAIADTLGWLHYQRGEYAEALPLSREAARDLAADPEVQYHLGMATAMMGEIEAARTALTAALKPGTGLPEDFPARAEIQARLNLLGGSGAPAKAVPLADLEAAATKVPNDPLVQFLLGSAREQQKDFPAAAAAYEKTIKHNPAHVPAIVNLARLNAGPLGDKKKALEMARNARQLASDDPATAGALGSIAFDAGDYAWAYDLLSQGKRAANPDAAVMRNLAWAAYSLGKVAEARENMQHFLDGSPESPQAAEAQAFLTLTAPALDEKSLAGLSAAAETTLQSDPRHVPALMIRARNQALKGETAPAIATCNAALERFPNFAPAQIQLAALYSGDPKTRDKAAELLTKARETLPDDPLLTRALAELNYYKKDYPYVIQLLEGSARKAPLSAEGLFYLGMAQWQNKDKSAAQVTLKQALNAGLPKSLAEQATTALEEAEKP